MSRTEPGTPESLDPPAGPPSSTPAGAANGGSGPTFRWPGLSARQVAQDAEPGTSRHPEATDGLGLPPLPNLRPLSIFRPFVPMSDATAAGAPLPVPVPETDTRAVPPPVAEPTTAPIPVVVKPTESVATPAASVNPPSAVGRGAGSIVVIGPAGPLRDAIAQRLFALGVDVVLPIAEALGSRPTPGDDTAGAYRFVAADPSDTDSMVGLIAASAGSDGDLGGVIVLPGAHRSGSVRGSADVETSEEFTDSLAGALSTDVLGVAAALHAAVGRLTTAGHAGRIVIVTGRGGSDSPGPAHASLPAELSEAALAVIATHLARAAGPQVGTILISAGAASGGETGSVDASAGVVDAVLLGVGPLLGLPGLQPIAGAILQLRL